MKKFAAIFSGLVLVFILNCSPNKPLPQVKQGDYASVQKYLTEYINQEIKKDQVVGLSIGLIDDQKLVWAQGFGYADKEKGAPATSQTLYRIGSISKLFTGTAVMQLAEQGKIDIDKPLQTYLPEFSIKTRFPDAGPITPRNMMIHLSGIPSNYAKGFFTSAPPSSVIPLLKESYVTSPPYFAWSYSNLTVSLLGPVVEAVSHQDFISYTDANIFAPLGMIKSSFELKPEMKPLLSSEYQDGKAKEHLGMRDFPAGSVYSNIEDLSRLPMMVFANGMSVSNRILKPETLKEMLTVQNNKVVLDFDLHQGLIWRLFDTNFGLPEQAGPVAWHTGIIGSFYSILAILPEDKLGVIVLNNSNTGNVTDIAGKALKLMLQAKTGINPQANQPIKLSERVRLSDQQIDQLVGTYDGSLVYGSYGLFEIKEKRGRLIFDKLSDPIPEHSYIDIELIPHKDGELTPVFKLLGLIPIKRKDGELAHDFRLLGLIPIKSEKLSPYLFPEHLNYFARQEINGLQVLSYNNNGHNFLFGVKLVPAPIPQAWLNRIGAYEMVDPDEVNAKDTGNKSLTIENGLLILDLGMKWALKPVSDTEAIVMGVGRSRGDTISIIKQNNEELLCYSGLHYRLKN